MPATSLRLSAFYAAYFGTVGVWLPFWPVWLGSRGLGAGAVGAVLAAGFWSRVLVGPLLARYADARGERKRPMIALAAFSVAAYGAFAGADSFWHYMVLSALSGASYTVLIPLADSLTLRAQAVEGIDYARVRLWGSLSFIATSIGAGLLLSSITDAWILWLVVAGVTATFLACSGLPGAPLGLRVTRQRGAAARLFTRPVYLVFLVTCGCLQASHGVYYGFATLHWRAAGHGDGIVGLLWAEGVLAEIALFLVGARITKSLRPRTLLAAAGVGGLLRWSVLGATTNLGALCAAQALHAFTFAAAHLGAMAFLSRSVPEELSATAQSVYSAVVGGLALGGAVSAAGILYGDFSGAAFYFAAALSGAGVPLALLLGRAIQRTPRLSLES